MLTLPEQIPDATPMHGPLSPLNAVWVGALQHRVVLPQHGHLLLIFPLSDRAVSCSGVTVDSGRYLMLTRSPQQDAFTLDMPATSESDRERAHLLVLWISPPFIADMARFLNIPDDLEHLLDGVPLLQGDALSAALIGLAGACRESAGQGVIEDHFLEAVGEVLRLMRLRHQALLALARHKRSTVADLLPRLLQARQFVEARYAERFKTEDVADYVALSEFHFARLFKTAFDTTVRQYVIGLRLDEARRLLEASGTSVTEAAFHVGYSSLSSFIHAFTRKFGVTPRAYQMQRENEQVSTSGSTSHVLK